MLSHCSGVCSDSLEGLQLAQVSGEGLEETACGIPAPLRAGLGISSWQERGAAGGHAGCCSWRRFLLNQIFFLVFTLRTDAISRTPPRAQAPSGAAALSAAATAAPGGVRCSPGVRAGMETPWAPSGMANKSIRMD